MEMEFVPMLWGSKSVEEFNERIEEVLEDARDVGFPVRNVLGMNE